jgi:dienelactone hydrolase
MARLLSILVISAATILAGAGASWARPAADGRGFDTVSIPLIAAGKPDPADNVVTGYLFMPDGGGPFPAVVIMHGCNGLDWHVSGTPGWALARRYPVRYVAHGYAALVLDSFEPRGLGNICGNPAAVSQQRRAWDAVSAARWLGARGDIDARRLVLQGDSHGGSTVLATLEVRRGAGPFAAGIASIPTVSRTRGASTRRFWC